VLLEEHACGTGSNGVLQCFGNSSASWGGLHRWGRVVLPAAVALFQWAMLDQQRGSNTSAPVQQLVFTVAWYQLL
jgi:hypothetical protein